MAKMVGALLIGGLAFAAGPASAGFEFRPPASAPAPTPAPAPMADDFGALPPPPPGSGTAGDFDTLLDQAMPTQPPRNPDRGAIVSGSGQNEPLAIAMQEIVPPDLQIAYDADIDPGRPVTWVGGVPWRDLAEDVLRPMGLTGVEDGEVFYVQTGQAPQRAQTPPTSAPAMDVVRSPEPLQLVGLSTGSSSMQVAQAGVPAPPPSPRTPGDAPPTGNADISRAWIVEEGRTLREVLGIWADAAGWQLVWDTARDYRIEASASFTGDFRQASSQLIRAFAAAQPPVVGTFYRNRTLVIGTLSDGDTE